jgi:hypothetical protein
MGKQELRRNYCCAAPGASPPHLDGSASDVVTQ